MNVNDNVGLKEELARYPLNPVRPLRFRVFPTGAGKFSEPLALVEPAPTQDTAVNDKAKPAFALAALL